MSTTTAIFILIALPFLAAAAVLPAPGTCTGTKHETRSEATAHAAVSARGVLNLLPFTTSSMCQARAHTMEHKDTETTYQGYRASTGFDGASPPLSKKPRPTRTPMPTRTASEA